MAVPSRTSNVPDLAVGLGPGLAWVRAPGGRGLADGRDLRQRECLTLVLRRAEGRGPFDGIAGEGVVAQREPEEQVGMVRDRWALEDETAAWELRNRSTRPVVTSPRV